MRRKLTIFAVDDSDLYLSELRDILRFDYNVVTVSSGQRCLSLLEKISPSLILLDIEMPGMNGFDVLAALKGDEAYRGHAHVPVIFLTAVHDRDVEARGLALGAVDFVLKPFSASALLNRIRLHINVSELIREQTAQLKQAHENMILVLANAVENRDNSTGGHIERTTKYTAALCAEMHRTGVYADALAEWDLSKVGVSALLHDVGKLSVSDSILNKPGRFFPEEFELMKTHVTRGAEIIDNMIALAKDYEFLHSAKMFALYHHENWDGGGYPYGLRGEEIPLQGRILALPDVWDALVSERPYKQALSFAQAREIMHGEVGKRFDPKIAEVFFSILDREASHGR